VVFTAPYAHEEDMLLLLGAFFAGVITVFAPCVFALLPVVIGGSMSGDVQDKRRPLIIAASLAVSLIVFTLLLKVTTLFIDVPPVVITGISGAIIVLLGLALLFPTIYDRLIIALNLQARSQRLLSKSSGKGALIGPIMTGAALGPVFSSCSPVYAYILATVLPVNFGQAMAYILAYVIGLSGMLLLIGFFGQKLVRKLKWASNPRGWFTRIVAILFVIVGLLIITGYDKKFQTYISENTPFNFDAISAKLIPGSTEISNEGVLNVEPYQAPEFTGINQWINGGPQRLSDLKGKVVLVDFWTYSCINCIRTQPYLKEWYSTYKDTGFEIIGIHAPEFSFEKNVSNVKKAVEDAGLAYPVGLDNDFKTWAAYNNQYWPATYLIDAEGNVRRVHFGEGGYKETEQAIRQLLSDAGKSLPAATTMAQGATSSDAETPETYLGTRRAGNYVGETRLISGERQYEPARLEKVNQWTLGGQWSISGEGITAVKDSVLRIRIAAKDVYLVTGAGANGSIGVTVNGKPVSQTEFAGQDVNNSEVTVSMAQLYKIVHFNDFTADATIELRVPAGMQLNTFTFGS
jgi:cytochrome c biogenesis protein CcdA/thiol-disulfide isomerase/thioredoxin